jgi:beta-glucanase (GH16 family)
LWLPFALLAATLIAASGFGIYEWTKPASQLSGTHARVTPLGAQTFSPRNGARLSMPRRKLPGWHEVFADSFNGARLDPKHWRDYSGPAGGDPATLWAPSHVAVRDGLLVIGAYRDPDHAGRWVTGGVTMLPTLASTYGKYLVRFRIDAGIGVSHALVLWPADNKWPPDINFSEDNGGSDLRMRAALHYGLPDAQISHDVTVNETHWHTLGVEWTPNLLRFMIDGRVWWTIHSRKVPHQPMVLAMQMQTWPCTSGSGYCPNSTTPRVVRMYLDWVVAYARPSRR